jgi:hypothetical protein
MLVSQNANRWLIYGILSIISSSLEPIQISEGDPGMPDIKSYLKTNIKLPNSPPCLGHMIKQPE